MNILTLRETPPGIQQLRLSGCVIGLREEYLYRYTGQGQVGPDETEMKDEEVCLRKQAMGKHRGRESIKG